MRLIDADALIEHLTSLEHKDIDLYTMGRVVATIDNEITIDTAPRGAWGVVTR